MSRVSDKEISKVLEKLEQMHPEASCALDFKTSFQLICAVALSAQTTDVSVNKVTPALFEKYPTAEAMATADTADVQEMIKTIGLYKNKSKNIVKMAAMLVEDFGGEVPNNMEDLTKLPGVGRKTANVVLSEGFGVPAIAVDTHVFRVANRIGLADAKNVEETEEQLKKCLPKEQWIRAHHLLIFHGRKVCHARKPECSSCALSDLCLYHRKVYVHNEVS